MRHSFSKGFTLIELLVVVGIIALLAAILMPALGRAREMAKSSACLSNMHNAGNALQIYQTANSGYFPTAYTYVNGEGSSGGYFHWTAAIDYEEYTDPITAGTYPRQSGQYVCPSHTPRGFAPTNFTAERISNPPLGQTSQDASGTIDDRQAARVSYVPNEAIMPRKKFCDAHDARNQDPLDPGYKGNTSGLCLVNIDEIAIPDRTILLAEYSDSPNCIYGSSLGGGAAFKSHRPTNGIKWEIDGTAGIFDGENWTTAEQADGSKPIVRKLTSEEAYGAIEDVLNAADPKTVAENSHHISYIEADAHKGGSNYLFVDGHAAKYTLGQTLDPKQYMWGRKVYSCVEKPEIKDNP